jgi:predicted nucleic acid-binding protein
VKALVIDGSTILGVLLRDEHSSYTERALEAIEGDRELYVPSHWWIEAVNGLLMAERRKRFSEAEMTQAFLFIQSLPVITDDETASRCGGDTTALARRYALTIYDAAYLELALRRRAGLATIDKALARAAKSAGVDVLA